MRGIAVGVDAGGTSTLAAVSRDGELLRTTEGEAANPSRLGIVGASGAIARSILSALDGALPDAIVVGAAGAGRDDVAQSIHAALQTHFGTAQIRVLDDAVVALRAIVPDGPGLVLIAGTGSIAYAEHDGTHARGGGHGYLLGDEGSGFALGSAAVKLLLRAYDERVPRDGFLEAIEAALDARTASEVRSRVYGAGDPVALLASLAPVAIEAANRGERSANKLVQAAALELADLVKSLVRRTGLAETGAPIVFAGGLLQANSLLTYLLEMRLQNDLPQMPIRKEPVEPCRGALAAAERLLAG